MYIELKERDGQGRRVLVHEHAAAALLAERKAKLAELAAGIAALSAPPPDAERIELRARTAGVTFTEAAEQLHRERDERRLQRGADLSAGDGVGHHVLTDDAVQAHMRASGLNYGDAASDLAGRGYRR